MKRILVLITFFVGLIPNLKDMCMESVYDVKGQSFYFEYEDETFPHCGICTNPDLVEVVYQNSVIYYCPDCQFYCDICHQSFDQSPNGEKWHETIHPKEEEEEEDDDDDDNGNNYDYTENLYICTTCVIPTVLTEAQKQEHIERYGHLYYKKVGE